METYSIQVQPENKLVIGKAGRSILDSVVSQGVAIPVGCKGGGCGICKILLVSGEIEHGFYSKSVLSNEEKQQGYVLACQARPKSDVTIRCVEQEKLQLYGR